jgi:hypothetical protein
VNQGKRSLWWQVKGKWPNGVSDTHAYPMANLAIQWSMGKAQDISLLLRQKRVVTVN